MVGPVSCPSHALEGIVPVLFKNMVVCSNVKQSVLNILVEQMRQQKHSLFKFTGCLDLFGFFSRSLTSCNKGNYDVVDWHQAQFFILELQSEKIYRAHLRVIRESCIAGNKASDNKGSSFNAP